MVDLEKRPWWDRFPRSKNIEDRRNAITFDPSYLMGGPPGVFKNIDRRIPLDPETGRYEPAGNLRRYSSPEFAASPAPQGAPMSPLDGWPFLSRDALGGAPTPNRLPIESPGRMESGGLTGIGGVPSATQLPQHPEQLLVPDVVSATDPAFTAQPQAQRVLAGLGRTPSASPVGDSPWSQFVSSRNPKYLKKSEIAGGLNMGTKGLDLPYLDQGNSTIIR